MFSGLDNSRGVYNDEMIFSSSLSEWIIDIRICSTSVECWLLVIIVPMVILQQHVQAVLPVELLIRFYTNLYQSLTFHSNGASVQHLGSVLKRQYSNTILYLMDVCIVGCYLVLIWLVVCVHLDRQQGNLLRFSALTERKMQVKDINSFEDLT